MIKRLIVGSVRNKLLMVTGFGTGLVLAVTLFGIYSAWQVEQEMAGLMHHEQRVQAEFLDVSLSFRTQLDEWKSLLLRGHEAELQQQHWAAFVQRHREVQSQADLLTSNVEDAQLESMLQEFRQLHGDLFKAYQSAYQQYQASAADFQAADQATRGLDTDAQAVLLLLQDRLNESLANALQLAEGRSQTSIQMTLVMLAIAVALSFVLFMVLIQKNIITPAKSLVEDFTQMANGDFSGRIKVHSSDEIGQVALAAEKLQQDIGELVQRINHSVYSVSTAAEEMSHVSDQANQAMLLQREETDQVATAMNQMTATVHEVSQNAQLAAESANQANSEVNTGQGVVNDAIRAIATLVQKVEQASDVILRLEADSVEIGSVLDVIRSIAEQTNLLALNAAIEAARAGEQGRGFAVVADEVRTLAQRTQTSTEEIQSMIERLQSGAQEAVESMNQSRSQADVTRDTAAEAGKVLTSITGSVTNINDMNALIASAAEQQNAVAEEINRNIVNISQAADNTSESVASTARASEELRNVAEQLKHVVSRLKV